MYDDYGNTTAPPTTPSQRELLEQRASEARAVAFGKLMFAALLRGTAKRTAHTHTLKKGD